MASSISKVNPEDTARSPAKPNRTKPLDWALATGQADVVVRGIEAEVRRNRRKRFRHACGAMAALIVAAGIWQLRQSLADPAASAIAAGSIVSIPQRQVLPDGTVVELKDGAKIVTQFSSAFRRVELQIGEAHFQIVPDPERPFVVYADGIEVRAVGTVFSVERSATQVEVLVTQGRVAVEMSARITYHGIGTRDEGSEARDQGSGTSLPASYPQSVRPMYLGPGNRVVLELAPQATAPVVVDVTPAEQSSRLAWRVPRLEFVATPLAEVVPAFNEHGKVMLVLSDPELGKLQLSGVLRADNVEVLLRLLETSYGLKVERRGEEIILRR